MIVKRKDGYHVLSEMKEADGKHKNLGGPYKTREEANKRLGQIEFFKHQNDNETKVAKVMKEFEEGTLKSSSGELVTSRKQAEAIALSEAGESIK